MEKTKEAITSFQVVCRKQASRLDTSKSRRTPAKQIKLLFLQLLLHRAPALPSDPHSCLFAYTAFQWSSQLLKVDKSNTCLSQQSFYLLYRPLRTHTHTHTPRLSAFVQYLWWDEVGRHAGNLTPHLLPIAEEWWSVPFASDTLFVRDSLCSVWLQINHAEQSWLRLHTYLSAETTW